MKIARIVLIVLPLMALAGAGMWILAGDDSRDHDIGDRKSHDGARAQHEDLQKYDGPEKVLPFDAILKKLRKQIRGEIIETEFEIEDGVPLYEIKYIREDGRVMELYVDARSGRIVKEEQD